jgi:hypothetical protein
VLSSGITRSLLGGTQRETIKKKNETPFLFPPTLVNRLLAWAGNPLQPGWLL